MRPTLMNRPKMKYTLSLLTTLVLAPLALCAMEPISIKTEFLENPLAIDTAKPRFSWIVEDATPGAKQTAYQVQASSSEKFDKADLWESGKITSEQSHLVEYAGKPLVSRQQAWWRVKTWDKDRKVGGWSKPATFAVTLLNESDWTAQWIKTDLKAENNDAAQLWMRMTTVPVVEANLAAPKKEQSATVEPEELRKVEEKTLSRLGGIVSCPMLRREVTLAGAIRRARAYVAAPGFFELRINGRKVGDRELEPGVTPFCEQVLYSVHDITPYLQQGTNAFGLILGHGYFVDEAGTCVIGVPMGQTPLTRAQFEIEYEDGRREAVVTDGNWKYAASPILKDSHWMGECYDARCERTGWDTAGFAESGWKNCIAEKSPTKRMAPDLVPPERVVRRIKAKKLYSPVEGVWVFDMGEVFSGAAELKVNVPAGTIFTMRYAQRVWSVDQKIGSLLHYPHTIIKEQISGMIAPSTGTMGNGGVVAGRGYQNLTPTDVYVAKGGGEEAWRRKFGYTACRYVELTGYPGKPPEDAVTGVVVHTDLPREGSFTSSDALLNQIYAACVNTYLYCTHGFTQDNPTREKQYCADMMAGNARLSATFAPSSQLWGKLVESSRLTQDETGHFLFLCGFRSCLETPVHESGSIQLAYLLWTYYGDDRPLARCLAAFAAYFDYYWDNPGNRRNKKLPPNLPLAAEDLSKGLLRGGKWCFDWYDTATVVDLPGSERKMPPYEQQRLFWGTAHSVENLDMFVEMACYAGRSDLVQKYGALAKKLREELNKTFYDQKNATYGCQGNDALALSAKLPSAEEGVNVAASIAGDIERRGGRFVAGTHGFPRLFDALSAHGYENTAYTIATRKGYPGMAHMLESGYGTLFEDWNTYNNRHGTVGAVVQSERSRMGFWFAEWLCGIRPEPEHPGFRQFVLGPVFPEKLEWAKAEVPSPYGKISSAWKRDGETIRWNVTVPWNTSATVKLPGVSGITVNDKLINKSEFNLPSGKWEIVAKQNKELK